MVPDKCRPDFWIAKLEQADDALKSMTEIDEFNKRITQALPDTVYDLTKYPAGMAASQLRNLITASPFPANGRYCNGQLILPEYHSALESACNLHSMEEKQAVKYAFAVRRTSIRRFPTLDVITATAAAGEFDLLQETAVNPAEPLLVLHCSLDGSWYFVQVYHYRGWVKAADVAIMIDREAWLDYIRTPEFLVVTGSWLQLGINPDQPELSRLIFAMGARLPLAAERPEQIGSQSSAGSYIIKLPTRDAAGNLIFRQALVPYSCDVTVGYLRYTAESVIRQVFKMLGERYGWGGLNDGRDCSALIADVYRSFGFILPRNADEQGRLPGTAISFQGWDEQRRRQNLDKLPPGTILQFTGHVMFYLGKHHSDHYVIHAIASCGENAGGQVIRKPLNAVLVQPLSLLRANGKRLLDCLENARILY